ncbi:MAG: EF-P lysine aminoacylase EpmA [Rubripirellula sp.]
MTDPNIELIRQRSDLLRELREFFQSRGFLEVQPPCLSQDCVVDAYIDPIAVGSDQFQLGIDLPANFFLQTSPEAAMKRLLAAGAPSIYSLGPVFRAGERGAFHNIEFTMLEWYDVGANIDSGIKLLSDLICELLPYDSCDVKSYRELFASSLGIDPITCSTDELLRQVKQVDSFELKETSDRDLLLDVLMSHTIQPTLGHDRPVVVRNYPLSQAALARQASDDVDCAARFELFVDGIELANGYDELCDAEILLSRAASANQQRSERGRSRLMEETSLVKTMRSSGLPACAGVAMGVDRLLMVRTGKKSIEKVIPFPIEIA